MKRVFPYQPSLGEGESARSYLHRLAEGNNYESIRMLSAVPDFASFYHQVVERKDIGIQPAWVKKLLGGDAFYRLSSAMPRHKNVTEARYCPECLRNDKYWRAEREYLYCTVCRIHETELRSNCEVCGDQIDWTRKKLMRCDCGAELESQRSVLADIKELKLWRELIALGNGELELNLLPLRSVTGSDNFEDACYFIRGFGRHYIKRYEPGKRNPQFPDLHQCRFHLLRTAEILYDWPANYRSFLLDFADLKTADPTSYVRSPTVKGFLKSITARPSSQASLETVDFFSKHEPIVWDKRHYGSGNLPQSVKPQKYLHITSFAEQLHVSNKTIGNLIRCGKLHSAERPRGKRKFVLIPSFQLERARWVLADRISEKEAGRVLGISVNRLRQLNEAKLLSSARRSRGIAKQFSYKNISKFLARFKTVSSEQCSDARSLKGINKYIAASDQEFIAIVEAMLGRALNIVGHEPSLGLLGGIHLSQRSLEEWREKRRRRILTVDEVARRLGLKQEVTYQLVHRGFIKSRTEKIGRRLGRVIFEEDIQEFSLKYISAVEMAETYGTSPRSLVQKLFKRMIHPETGPKIDGGRQYFYLRAYVQRGEFLKILRND